jgi:hypothetical protein
MVLYLDSVQAAIERLKGTPGVVACWVLPDGDRETLQRLESDANHRLALPGIEIVNEGVCDVLQRQHVLVISHSPQLRHPPAPIIVILDGEDVVGEEVWEPKHIEELSKDSNSLLLGRNLAFNREALTRARGKKLRLVYKGLPFPELGEVPAIRDTISVTITIPAHLEFSKKAGWNPDDPDLGTVLIGFNDSARPRKPSPRIQRIVEKRSSS